jgi:hypothetical protein
LKLKKRGEDGGKLERKRKEIEGREPKKRSWENPHKEQGERRNPKEKR